MRLTIEALLFVFEIHLLCEAVFLQERMRWMLKLRDVDGCRSVEIVGIRMATVPMLPVVVRRDILIVGVLLPTPTIPTHRFYITLSSKRRTWHWYWCCSVVCLRDVLENRTPNQLSSPPVGCHYGVFYASDRVSTREGTSIFRSTSERCIHPV